MTRSPGAQSSTRSMAVLKDMSKFTRQKCWSGEGIVQSRNLDSLSAPTTNGYIYIRSEAVHSCVQFSTTGSSNVSRSWFCGTRVTIFAPVHFNVCVEGRPVYLKDGIIVTQVSG